jgi:hypothetical protein
LPGMIAYTRHGTNKLSGEKCQKQDVILESIFLSLVESSLELLSPQVHIHLRLIAPAKYTVFQIQR